MQRNSHGEGQFDRLDLRWFHDPPLDSLKSCGSRTVIESTVKIFQPQTVSIGQDCYIGHRTILKGYLEHGGITIGDDCWMGENVYLNGAGGITIGRRVGIGPGVYMLTSYHDESFGLPTVMDNPLAFKGITIEDGADIEARAFICAGVTIGENAIIRAGSVVVKLVEANTIVAGNPAVFKRNRTQ